MSIPSIGGLVVVIQMVTLYLGNVFHRHLHLHPLLDDADVGAFGIVPVATTATHCNRLVCLLTVVPTLGSYKRSI